MKEHSLLLFLKKLQRIPISVIVISWLLCCYGTLLLYSAANGSFEPWALRHIVVCSIFTIISIIIALIDLRVIYRYAYLIYIISVLMVFIVEISGKSAMGATRWLHVGFLTIQPSELVKISIILMLARYLHNLDKYNYSDYYLLIPLIMVLLPIALVIKQPDLGTGIITLIISIVVFFVSGQRLKYFIICGVLGIIILPIFWHLLHGYQKSRLMTFLDPGRDPLGAGYNIIQSKIAIGSGGLFGKGLFSSTQGHLSFLPEYHTDFIFAFLTEELGFIGGMVLIILYAILIIDLLLIAVNCKSNFAFLVVIGVATFLFAHIFINIAMVSGLLPVVGVPLPFISYGRTMMGSIFIALGLVMNMSINRYSNV